MTIRDPELIKKIVRTNFDESPSQYDNFEKKYGLFRRVTKSLASLCKIERGMHVCDVGCGTGTSTFALAEIVGTDGSVTGIDFSEEMLATARKSLLKFGVESNIDFICCDAETIGDCIKGEMDAVLYNACIFLIPNTEKTLEGAHRILKDGGIVGMNHIVRILEAKGGDNEAQAKPIDIFQSARETGMKSAPYGRSIIDTNTLPPTLKGLGFSNIREGTFSQKMSEMEVREFYSIPAQSAGLYPKTPNKERLEMLNSLLNHFRDEGIDEFEQVWGWCTGIK
jgi:ubiquinone/menaquinone biosynthesis C-methylase UbiE